MHTGRGSRLPRRSFPGLLALCVLVAGLLAPTASARTDETRAVVTPSAPAADSGLESQFVGRVNSLRASKGLNQLAVAGDLHSVARAWTDRMVGAGAISHNGALGSQVGGGWTKLGENVGVGYDVGGLMQAFINSPDHYRNLVDPAWTQIGVGVSVAPDGRIFTTHNFAARGAAAPAPPPPATTTPAPPPPTTAPVPAPATTSAPAPPTTSPAPPPPPEPHPTTERVTAVLDPLRSLESA